MSGKTIAVVVVIVLILAAAYTLDAPEVPDVTVNSDVAYALYQRGMDFQQKLMPEEALEPLEEAIKIDHEFLMAKIILAKVNMQLGNINKARTLIDDAYEDRFIASDWEMHVVEIEHALGVPRNIQNADDLINLMAENYPDRIESHIYKAYQAALYKDLDAQIDAYERILEIDPEYPQAYNYLGYLYGYRREFDKAVERIKVYVKLLPDQPNPHDSYADILLMQGDFEKALEQLLMALALRPQMETESSYLAAFIHQHIAQAYTGMGQIDDAIDAYDKARELGKNNPEIYIDGLVNRFNALLLGAKTERFVRDMPMLNSLDEHPATIVLKFLMRGIFYTLNDRLDAAQAELDSMKTVIDGVLVMNPDAKPRMIHFHNLLLAQMSFERGEYEKSLILLDEDQKLNPDIINISSGFIWRKARALREIGLYDKALKFLETGMSAKPNVYILHAEKALLYYDRREYNKAKKEIKKFFKITKNADPGIFLSDEMKKLMEAIEVVS